MYGPSEPDYSTTSELLTHLNSDELKKLLNDDVSLNGILKDVPHVGLNFLILISVFICV